VHTSPEVCRQLLAHCIPEHANFYSSCSGTGFSSCSGTVSLSCSGQILCLVGPLGRSGMSSLSKLVVRSFIGEMTMPKWRLKRVNMLRHYRKSLRDISRSYGHLGLECFAGRIYTSVLHLINSNTANSKTNTTYT